MPKKTSAENQYDLAIAGGGLAGGLIALALNKLRPEINIALIEAEDRFGGNHIWSFFDSDVEPEHRWLVDPLISSSWDSYDVHFPKYSRSLSCGYNSIQSSNLDRELRSQLPETALKVGHKVKKIKSGLLKLQAGGEIAANAILDVRGGGDISALEYGWQKFRGHMLRLKKPHGLDRPVIMDATVDQLDGYRFVYSLPFGDKDVFVEDTYYSDSKEIDPEVLDDRIAEYANDQDWRIDKVTHSESGQLPVLYGGDFDAFWADNKGPDARAGVRAALVQPITSYSLPMAVKTAMIIADMPKITQKKLDKLLKDLAFRHWSDGNFYRMLCAMMFKAAKPEKRYLTLEHTYAKDEALIERFYAGKTTLLDQASLLSGKPPVPITKALPIMMKYR